MLYYIISYYTILHIIRYIKCYMLYIIYYILYIINHILYCIIIYDIIFLLYLANTHPPTGEVLDRSDFHGGISPNASHPQMACLRPGGCPTLMVDKLWLYINI